MTRKGEHHTEEAKRRLSTAMKNSRLNAEHLQRLSERPVTKETRKKMSDAQKGKRLSAEHIRRVSNAMKGRRLSPEHIRKLSETKRNSKNCMEHMRRLSEANKGKHPTKETRRRLSKAIRNSKHCVEQRKRLHENQKGEGNPRWLGGISFLPYCHKFNKQLKERIRDRDNRTCQLCGERENGRKLDVHHVHYDKEDCDPDLIALCSRCNAKANTNRDYYEGLFTKRLEIRGLLTAR